MKTNSIILALIACCLSTLAFAQVEINKNLQMTGGTNADRLITNVGDPSTSTGAVNVQSLQKGTLIYAVTGGTANAITATTTPSFAPQAGSTICFKATATNTGAVTLNVNGSGAVNLLRGNTALVAGDIQANQLVTATYDGATWQATGGVGDNLGNHQATQTVTANANNVYDIGNSTNGFKDLYLTGSLKLDNTVFVNNLGGSTLLGETQNTTNTANSNLLVGYQSGKSNTTGYDNVFIGKRAGYTNTTGAANLFLGIDAGYSTTSGLENVFIGYAAGRLNSSGGANVYIGYRAGDSGNGNYNTFIGPEFAGANFGTGSRNIMIGHQVGYNSNGSYNIFHGEKSGYNTTANYNMFMGIESGYSNTSGTQNIFLGYQSGYSNLVSNNNCYLGVQAGMCNTGSDNVAIGNYSGTFGIIPMTMNSTNGVFVGRDAVPTASGLDNVIAIGKGAQVSTSNTIQLGNSTIASLRCQVALTIVSDSTKKENFKPINSEEVLVKIRTFRLTSWNYKEHDPKKFRHYGPMAQDFYNAFGYDGIGRIGSDTTINTGDLAGISFVAIQALEKRTSKLKELVDKKDQTIEKQLEEINKLKADIGKLQSHLDLIKVENQTMNQEIAEIKTLLKKSSSVAVKE